MHAEFRRILIGFSQDPIQGPSVATADRSHTGALAAFCTRCTEAAGQPSKDSFSENFRAQGHVFLRRAACTRLRKDVQVLDFSRGAKTSFLRAHSVFVKPGDSGASPDVVFMASIYSDYAASSGPGQRGQSLLRYFTQKNDSFISIDHLSLGGRLSGQTGSNVDRAAHDRKR